MKMTKIKIENIKQLVFQGGSVKGIAYLGAWEKLLESGLDPRQIKRVAGTSAGAITALLLALGYDDPNELKRILGELNFKEMLDEVGPVKTSEKVLTASEKMSRGGMFGAKMELKAVKPTLKSRLKKEFGIYQGVYLRKKFEDMILEKTKILNLTFAELHELKRDEPEKGYKDLYVVGCNFNTKMSEVFSYKDTPNFVIADAIRISMSIPFLFIPHQAKIKTREGDVVSDPSGHLYVDGGLLDNYPIYIFDRDKDGELKISSETLGLRLLKKEKIDFFQGVGKAPEKEAKGPMSYLVGMKDTLMNKQDSDHEKRPEDKVRSVYIDTLGVDMLSFDLTEEQKEGLIQSGREAVNEYFDIKPALRMSQ